MFSSHQLYLYVNPWIAIFQVFLMKVGVEQFELTKINFLLYLNEVQCKRFFAKAWLFKFMVSKLKVQKVWNMLFLFTWKCAFLTFSTSAHAIPQTIETVLKFQKAKIGPKREWSEQWNKIRQIGKSGQFVYIWIQFPFGCRTSGSIYKYSK